MHVPEVLRFTRRRRAGVNHLRAWTLDILELEHLNSCPGATFCVTATFPRRGHQVLSPMSLVERDNTASVAELAVVVEPDIELVQLSFILLGIARELVIRHKHDTIEISVSIVLFNKLFYLIHAKVTTAGYPRSSHARPDARLR